MSKELKRLQAAQERFEQRGGFGPQGPLDRWVARQDLKVLQRRFVAGDQMALFIAIQRCAHHGLVMPPWVARAFIHGYDKVVYECRANSWGAVFGTPYRKNTDMVAMRRHKRLLFKVYHVVNALHRSDPKSYPIDGNTFEVVGEQFKISGATVGRLYGKYKRFLKGQPPLN